MSKTESMESKIYDLMDWAAIEAVVYAEEDEPGEILGPHVIEQGILIQAYFPGKEEVSVRTDDGKEIPMVLEDEAGYFAVLLDGKKIPAYQYVIREKGKKDLLLRDPYAFPCQITEKEAVKFSSGSWDQAYLKMGAHPMEINGTKGVFFAVWAPNALRVSVVGDFNAWDGRTAQMNRLPSGIFWLFVPEIPMGTFYKYELKLKNGLVYLKADPYANEAQQLPEAASVVTDLSYDWKDAAWMTDRKKQQYSNRLMAIYEVNIGDWKKKEDGTRANWRELAPSLAAYIKDMGYTHVELMPIMEYPDDDSLGYGTSGYFAPTSRYGTPTDFMYFVDIMHKNGIGVILDWTPSSFARGNDGLASFDGTCLYEHLNPKQGVHPSNGQLIFNYGRGEVVSFLKASALFWLRVFHADGLRVNDVATMVYLDYGRRTGQWIANMYGGNENLEGIAFLKSLNLTLKEEEPGTLMIAEEETGYPEVTGSAEKNGLGFDYKWNNGCISDYLQYIQLDPLFRGSHQDDLTMSSVYMYSEKFILALSHTCLGDGGAGLLQRMPGAKRELKAANLRLTYAYLMAHPGKKLLFMGQDFGQEQELTSKGGVAWNELNSTEAKQMRTYCQALLQLYREQPALYELDENPEGFEWISNLDWERNLLVFLRKSMKTEELLLVIANFSNVEYDNFMVGVPFSGKYKEIFNSDALAFGGTGAVNPRVKLSRAVEQDERKDSIKVKVPPLGVSIYRFTEAVERRSTEQTEEKTKKAAVTKTKVTETAPKKAGAAKTTATKTKAAKTSTAKAKTTLTKTVRKTARSAKK